MIYRIFILVMSFSILSSICHALDDLNENWNPEVGYDFRYLKELPEPSKDLRYGEHMKRTMHLLSTSTKERPNKVKILFYGQSITRQDYSRKIIEAMLREKFPHAQLEVLNPAIGGYQAPRSLLTMHHTLIPEQPDLVVFHVYGGEDDGSYEEILKRIREETSAELVCVTHHLDNYGPEQETQRDEASQLRRDLARKYNAELVDVRKHWRRYLEMHDLRVEDLLVDKIHHNQHGGELWGALQARHFQVQPANPIDWDDRVSQFDLREGVPDFLRLDPSKWSADAEGLRNNGAGGILTIPFEGSRLDAVIQQGRGRAEIRVDGRKPSEILSNWAANLPSQTPIDYRPAIMRVILHGQPVEETWRVTVEWCSDDGNEFIYSVRGSISGDQGEGDHTSVYRSKNDIIELRPEWFTMEHAIRIKREPIPTPFEITWSVYPMVPDVLELSIAGKKPIRQTTLVQCLPDGAHELTIGLLDGVICIEEILIYKGTTRY
jgi:hypothetical protein